MNIWKVYIFILTFLHFFCSGGSHRKSILKKQQSCDSSPDLIPHSDQGVYNLSEFVYLLYFG